MKQIQQVNNIQTAMVDVWQVQIFEILMIICIGQVFILGLMIFDGHESDASSVRAPDLEPTEHF